MSGDVQPRKRKDKKKKKDDLGVEEPRGTAAALGEGDVFMHSQSEHGTGGHWCAKVIFFSLLAVLITLIGLIILENRGLTELEANSVESRYSGVLEGWIEDTPDDDHHDEHTLELKHHDEDDDDHGSELEHDEDDDHDDDDDDHDDENEDHENDDDDENEEDDDHDNENDEDEQDADDSEEANDNADDDGDDQDSEEHDLHTAEENEDDVESLSSYKKYYENIREDNDDDDDDLQKEEIDNEQESTENRQDHDEDDEDSKELDDDTDDDKQDDDSLEAKEEEEDNDDRNDDYLQNDAAHEDEDEHEEEEPANIEIESIEKEVSDDDVASTEEPAEEGEDQSEEVSEELPPGDDSSVEDDDVEFLEPDELDELPIVEPITAPKGKPLPEVGDNPTEKPQDTLADEEEYERQQEELRKEREQASQGMWLKLTVGGALLVATHAVLRRATASRETETEDEPDFREETPISDRRMTLISEPVPPPTVAPKTPEAPPKEKEVIEEAPTIVQTPPSKQDLEEDEEEIIVTKPTDTIDRELYSDEEELDEEVEDEEEEEIIQPTKTTPQQAVPQTPQIPDVTKEVTPEPEEDDDVEIIDEEQLEEELEEEEISDVDDAELLNRLEEKYGRLPEPERPGRTHKDGGNSIEDEWPGEPADAFWSAHLEQAQRELRQGEWIAAVETASAPNLASSARAKYIAAQALDAAAEAKKDNQLLNRAIAAYLDLLKMNEKLSDKKLLEVATRALDRIKFRGTYLNAEPVYKLLIRRFPNDPIHRNNLTISLLMANRADLAEDVLKETLKLWPNDRVALAHHGFILKTLHNRLEEAVKAFSKALEGDAGAANEPRFYFHLGDALLLLGRFDEAHEVHKRGAALGHFLSPNQRSLYNVDRLKSKPWWSVDQTPYSRLARALEKSWKEILKEGEAAKAMYEKEKEGLKERGEWSQLDLFVRGREVPNRCSRAPITCGIVKSELAASGCRRGQIKFSMMEAGTHVRPHVGPTNCRLRMHLGLSNTKDTFIRVDRETRQWQTGKVLLFDDSFEHEVWHNGTGTRLVLIVDVWHPDLTPAERRQLPAI